MNALSERALAHAHALRARSAVLPPEGPPREEILESWSRSQQAGLDFATSLKVEVVPLAELERRRERAAVVRRLAQAELETLSQQIAGSNFLLAFADPDGVVLDLFADHRFETTGSTRQILAGSVWTERACGTNGLGTALAAGRSVAVSGLEHYVLELGDISCTATPVRDAHGEVVGALDASSYFESRQRHTQTLVQMAAAQMENGLFAYQMRHEFMLAIHPRHEFLNTLNAGLLALGGDGRLRAVNSRGRQLLQGLHVTPGTAFDALFGEPFEEALVRMRRGGEVRLRDVMGSALAARCLGDGTGLFAQRFPGSATGEGAVRAAVAMPGNAADGANALAPASPAHADSIRLGAAAADVVVARARSRSQAKSESESESESPSASASPSPSRASAVDAARGVSARQGMRGPTFVAADERVQEAVRFVEAAVRARTPILIVGETGTGKELLARHAHAASDRPGDFVALNCAAIPAELFEAELFGYVGGSFSGARREGSAGLIASAHRGTLLFDEIRELPVALQAALLRFLDDGCIRAVGATTMRQVDVQILAATNVEPADDQAAGRLRGDLLYRLDAVRVVLPPLRQRRDFAAAARATLQAIDGNATLTDDALAHLARAAWPGNFRQLRAVLTRALMLHPGGPITHDDVAPLVTAAPKASTSALQRDATETVCNEFERTGRSVSRTSRNLGISRTTVYRHLRAAGR